MWVEWTRRILYEGIFLGINIWFLMVLFISLGLIYVNWQRLKVAFTPRYWKRRFVANHINRLTVEVDMPPPDEEIDRKFLIKLNKIVVEGIERYADKNDIDGVDDRLMSGGD